MRMPIPQLKQQVTKVTGRHRYTEIIPRPFLIGQNSQSWDQMNVFSAQPNRRFIIAISTNAVFVGDKQLTHSTIKNSVCAA